MLRPVDPQPPVDWDTGGNMIGSSEAAAVCSLSRRHMPINTALLVNAGLATSKNDVLQRIHGLVLEYNGLPQSAASRDRAIRLLDKIMKHAAIYLTSKPPQTGKLTNRDRWDALTDLATQAVAESRSVGVKLLSGPADFRNIKFDPALGAQSYWLERVDPRHRAGFQLSKKYEQWIAQGSAVHGKTTFWDFADSEAMMEVLFLGEGVVDGDGAPIRECYRVTFDANGLAVNNDGSPFTTRDMETAHSGDGWGVFVVDPNGKLYARSHEVGYFHHSTFLAGRPVAAAGELLSDDTGKIRLITAKTGHYKAGLEEMIRMVTLIPQLPGDALILPDFTKMLPPAKGGISQALLYKVSDFRARGAQARIRIRDEVIAAFPGFGDTSQSVRNMINKVPTVRPLDASAPTFVPTARAPMNPNAPAFVPRGAV